MTPLNIDDATTDLAAAYLGGDPARIAAAETLVDQLDVKPASSLHGAALWYASVGIKVFPLSPGSKIPFKGSGGCKDATTDAAMIDAWWGGNPHANIGIATGFLVDVVDIDGAIGQQSRCENWDMFSGLDVLGRVSTPRPGGMHLYVPRREGIGNGAHLLPGIDYRGLGGYVVAPPSVNAEGVGYRWISPINVAAVEAAA